MPTKTEIRELLEKKQQELIKAKDRRQETEGIENIIDHYAFILLKKEILTYLKPLLTEIKEINLFGSYIHNPEQANDIDVHILLKKDKYKNLTEFNKIAQQIVNCFTGKTFNGKKYDILPETVKTPLWFREGYIRIS